MYSIDNRTQGRRYFLNITLGHPVVSHHSSLTDQLEGLVDTEWIEKNKIRKSVQFGLNARLVMCFEETGQRRGIVLEE